MVDAPIVALLIIKQLANWPIIWPIYLKNSRIKN